MNQGCTFSCNFKEQISGNKFFVYAICPILITAFIYIEMRRLRIFEIEQRCNKHLSYCTVSRIVSNAVVVPEVPVMVIV